LLKAKAKALTFKAKAKDNNTAIHALQTDTSYPRLDLTVGQKSDLKATAISASCNKAQL